ncbi:MAG: transposase, partial [Magnetovibrio sp.]|nr:transposase [Magnetovibrio sp.]
MDTDFPRFIREIYGLWRNGQNTRLCLEAVLWRVRTGSPWRDLPSGFGHWNST